MTVKASFSTKGFEAYLEDIQRAGKDIDAAATRALQAGAEIVQNEMRALVPVDTGNLLEHIKIRGPFTEGNRNFVEIGVIHQVDYTDAETAKYGNAQEYGWLSGGKYHHGKSYIRAGWDQAKRNAMKAIRESLKAEGMVD